MKEQLREFVCRTTFSDPNKIKDATLLFDEGIFDSMGLLNLIAFLEEDYGIKVEDSELDAANFGSIDAIASFLERKMDYHSSSGGSIKTKNQATYSACGGELIQKSLN